MTGRRKIAFGFIVGIAIVGIGTSLLVAYGMQSDVPVAHALQECRRIGREIPLANGDMLGVERILHDNGESFLYMLERRTPSGDIRWRRAICESPIEVTLSLDAMLADDSLIVSAQSEARGGALIIDPQGEAAAYQVIPNGARSPDLLIHVSAEGGVQSHTQLEGGGGETSFGVHWGQMRDIASPPEGLDLSGEKHRSVAWMQDDSGEVFWSIRFNDGHVSYVHRFSDGSLLLSGTFINSLEMNGQTVLTQQRTGIRLPYVFLVRWTPETGVMWARSVDAGFGSDGYFVTAVSSDNTVIVATPFRGHAQVDGLGHFRARRDRSGVLLTEFSADGDAEYGSVVAQGMVWPSYVYATEEFVIVRVDDTPDLRTQIEGEMVQAPRTPFSLVARRTGRAQEQP